MSTLANLRLKRAVPWIVLESAVNAASGIGMMILIGRLIGPDAYGQAVAAISTVLLIEMISNFGIADALAQSATPSRRTMDTAFWTALTFGVCGSLAALALAPVVASVYGDPDLMAMVAVQGLSCTLTGLAVVPLAQLTRKLRARALLTRSLLNKLAGLGVALVLALAGFGAWSVIIGMLAGTASALVVLWACHPRLPAMQFSRIDFLQIARFGGVLSLDTFIGIAGMRVSLLLIGMLHGYAVLGYFAFALRIADELSTLIGSIVSKFGLAYFSSMRAAPERKTLAFKRGIHYAAALSFPIYFGLAATAPDAVPLIFGARWAQAVPVVQVFAVVWAFTFTQVLVAPLLRSIGRQTELLLATSTTSVLTISVIAAVPNQGVVSLAIVLMLKHILVCAAGLYVIRRHYGVGIADQLEPIMRPFAAGCILLVAVAAAHMTGTDLTRPVRLIACIASGAAAYVLTMLVIDRRFVTDMMATAFAMVGHSTKIGVRAQSSRAQ